MYSQLRTACKTAGVGNSLTSFGPMEYNDSHVKCTSLQFVVNTNMKVASDSIIHVTVM